MIFRILFHATPLFDVHFEYLAIDFLHNKNVNNSLKNLRIATRKEQEQEQNSKGIKDGTKRERKKSAKDLPEGITQEMMKKYENVYYFPSYEIITSHANKSKFFEKNLRNINSFGVNTVMRIFFDSYLIL